MDIDATLIPELALWNFGKGISPDHWIFAEGRADHALGLCAMLWPGIRCVGPYIFREPVNMEHLRGWESGGCDRRQVETAMNAYFLENIFPHDPASPELKSVQVTRLVDIMMEMLRSKLAMAFPDRSFDVFVIDDGDDFAVSFHQA